MASTELQEIRLDVEEGTESVPVAAERVSAATEEITAQQSKDDNHSTKTAIGALATRDKVPDKWSETAATSQGQAHKHHRVVESSSSQPNWFSATIGNILGTDDDLNLDLEFLPHTGLHQAVRDSLSKMVDTWIDYFSPEGEDGKAKLNERDEHGMAAVHYAAKFNRLEILKKLHDNGADLTLETCEELYTPLHFAASYIPRYKIQQCGSGNQAIKKSYLSSSKEMVEFLVYIAKVELNPRGKNNVTPLHLACQRGNLDVVLILLSQTGIIESNVHDTHGDTPLHQACRYGNEEIVEELVKNKTLSKSLCILCNRENQTPLHLACQEGHTVIVRKLLEKCPSEEDGRKMLLEARDNEGNTALHLAIESLRVKTPLELEIVKDLLEYGADPSEVKITKQTAKKGHIMQIGDRATPLHLAVRYGLVNVITLLLDHNELLVGAITTTHQTPLHLAAIHNQVDAAELLIARGADTESKDINSCTPFLVAAANGSTEVVAKLEELEDKPIQADELDKDRKSAVYLAAEGAHLPLLKYLLGTCNHDVEAASVTDPICNLEQPPLVHISRNLCNTPDVNLNTPLHVAARLGHLDIVEELLNNDLLKENHVKLDAKNSMNKTPAHLAAEHGHFKILEKLTLKKKRLVFDEDDDGNTPLHLAARQGWKQSVKLLLDQKTNIDARNADLATPLSLAAGSGHEHVVTLLLQSKAEVDIQDRSQATPLHYAITKGHIGVVKILLQNGASCSRKDKDWYNALDLAIESGHEDVARIIVQSDQWEDALRSTTERDTTNEPTTPFRKLIVRMPDVAREVLNRCTVYEERDGESQTKYNYRYIDDFRTPPARRLPKTLRGCLRPFFWWIKYSFPKHGYRNTWGPRHFNKFNHPLTLMAESNDSRLLSHPLVISLLMFKLRTYVSPYYLFHLIVHLVLLISITIFALTVPNPNDMICQLVDEEQFNTLSTGENQLETCSEPYDNFTVQAQCGSCGSISSDFNTIHTFAVWVGLAAFIRIVIVSFTFVNRCRHRKALWNYFWKLQLWIEVPMLLLSFIFVSVHRSSCLCPAGWQWQIGTVAVLLVWVDLIQYFQSLQLFDIGIYILMFGNIIVTFIRVVLLSFLLLIAFSLAFYMAFYRPGAEFSTSPFYNPAQSFLTILTYSLGGADYNGLFALSHEGQTDLVPPPFLTVSIILWVLFLIGMLILLINMLIGLAVEDIQGIKKAAEVQRLKLLVDLTLSVDDTVFYRHLLTIPEGTCKRKGWRCLDLWRRFNDMLWEGKIEQDTPEKIAETLTNQSEPSIEQVHIHTNSLVKEVASLKETVKALNERNRRMEAALVRISSVLEAQSGSSPSARQKL